MVSFSGFYCIICLSLSIPIRRRIFRITLLFRCITIMYIPVRDGQEHWHLPYLVGRPGMYIIVIQRNDRIYGNTTANMDRQKQTDYTVKPSERYHYDANVV